MAEMNIKKKIFTIFFTDISSSNLDDIVYIYI